MWRTRRTLSHEAPRRRPVEYHLVTARGARLTKVSESGLGSGGWILVPPRASAIGADGKQTRAWQAGAQLNEMVLVRREMECGRSPLASIARASAGRVARPNSLGKKSPESRLRGASNGMPRRASAVHMLSERSTRGLGRLNFQLARHPGANQTEHMYDMATTHPCGW